MLKITNSNQKTDAEKRRQQGDEGSSPPTPLSPNIDIYDSIFMECSCGHTWEYRPRSPNKLPKDPKSKCSKCNKWIRIKRTRLIKSDHYNAIDTYRKSVENFVSREKVSEELTTLKFLDQGLYAQEITRKGLFSASKLSRIINSLLSRGFITQIQRFPKIFQLTNVGKVFLEKGDLSKKKLDNEITDKRIKPKWVDKLRVHKLRFKNKLIQKPSWLYRILREGKVHGLNVQKVELNNWSKFIITFNYHDFNGLEKIEVCNNSLIYNFNKVREEQYVDSEESLTNYIKARIEDCKEVRTFLEQKGFVLDKHDPIFCQKPHFAIESFNEPKALGSIGTYLTTSIQTPSETREIDDSPGTGGEEETDSIEKAVSMFDVPKKIEQLEMAIVNMTNQISNLTQALVNLVNGNGIQKPKIPDAPGPGGMFQ